MILWLHRLRRDEEGQTLVLGAVFGVILALCVMGSVNLGRAVYEKIQVQTACDNGAYSQAAMEARVLNFTAYTNRAMVVHYSSMMAMSAYQTWLHFTWVWLSAILQAFSYIPYIGPIFSGIQTVLQDLLDVLDYAVFFMTPVVSAASTVLWLLQEGAWLGLYGNRLANTGLPPEAHSGDSGSKPFKPVWGALTAAANSAVFAQTRGSTNLLLPMSQLQSMEILFNWNTPAVQEARLHMVEIANSAREPWVAYGDRYNNASFTPLARHWLIDINVLVCDLKLGINARSQLGTWAPGFSLSWVLNGGLQNTPGQIWSASRGQAQLSCHVPILGSATGLARVFDLSTMDQLIPIGAQHTYQGYALLSLTGNRLLRAAIGAVLSLLSGLGNAALSYSQEPAGQIQMDTRLMWISPYVFFAPSTKAGPAGGATAVGPGLGNFGQPDVVMGIARARNDFNAAPAGNPNAFLNQHQVGSIVNTPGHTGSVDFSYTGNDWPGVTGLPAGFQLQPGFNAICAAQAYYHRPGDWKEMPNFFNPLWAARLMPVTESNAGAALFLDNPAVSALLLH